MGAAAETDTIGRIAAATARIDAAREEHADAVDQFGEAMDAAVAEVGGTSALVRASKATGWSFSDLHTLWLEAG
jgi:hypothetical protein